MNTDSAHSNEHHRRHDLHQDQSSDQISDVHDDHLNDHHHNHAHDSHEHHHMDSHHHHLKKDSRSLTIAMICTGFIFVVQLVGSFISHSLALLSDSGHMLIDFASLGIAFFGLRLALKRSNLSKFSFGWRRVEILAALLNGTILLIVCAYIFYEAIARFQEPEHVLPTEMLVVAVIGLVANGISLYFLHDSHHLTTRSAYLHVLTDLLSSVGVIIGAIIIRITSWDIVDPIISVVITIFIARSAYLLIKRAAIILMESTPDHLNIQQIQESIQQHEGVNSVHDMHLWQIGSSSHAFSAHVVVQHEFSHDTVLSDVQQLLQSEFGLTHSTLQLESIAYKEDHDCQGCEGELHDHDRSTPQHS